MTVAAIDGTAVRKFRAAILDWGDRNRRSFFWRDEPLSLFEALVVEILLARTRAEAAEPVAQSLMERAPTPQELVSMGETKLRNLLEPLGLHRKRAAALVKFGEELSGRGSESIPSDPEVLISLPYVGRYAANAAVCFSRGVPRPIVDANVARVLERGFGLPSPDGKLESEREYWELARRLVPEERPRDYNWSLIDLGAVLCRPRTPICESCPLRQLCRFAQAGST